MTLTRLLAVSLLAFAGMAQAQTSDLAGYDNTRWGMSPDQVLSAEAPAAMLQPDGTVLIPDLVVAGDAFDAVLTFSGRGVRNLASVLLVSRASSETDAGVVFAHVEASLRAQFGTPTLIEDGSAPTMTWRLPTTTVQLRKTQAEGGSWTLTVKYLPTM